MTKYQLKDMKSQESLVDDRDMRHRLDKQPDDSQPDPSYTLMNNYFLIHPIYIRNRYEYLSLEEEISTLIVQVALKSIESRTSNYG